MLCKQEKDFIHIARFMLLSLKTLADWRLNTCLLDALATYLVGVDDCEKHYKKMHLKLQYTKSSLWPQQQKKDTATKETLKL